MEKFRSKYSNRVCGRFTYEGREYECFQKGGYPSKNGWVGEPAYLVVDTVIGNIRTQVMAVYGDYSLSGEEVVRRWEDVMNKGLQSEYFVPEVMLR